MKKDWNKNKLTNLEKIFIALVIVVINITCLFVIFRPKFKDVTIELGTEEIDLNTFVTAKMFRKKAICLTDVEEIDLSVVGTHNIEFTYQDMKKVVKLKIVDTKAPVVKFKNVEAGTNYKFDVLDFIENVEDESEYEVKTKFVIAEPLEFKDYDVLIDVVDREGNKTSEKCKLTIEFALDHIKHEYGEKLKAEEFIRNPADYSKIKMKTLSSIDVKKLGSQKITYEVGEKEYKLTVDVVDTTPPELILRDLTYYLGDKEKVYKDFVKSVKDASGDVELSYEADFDFKKLGVYKLKVTAKDASGNVTTKTATLTVKADNRGPVFSGLTNLTVDKETSIDFNANVKAVDARDGEMPFTVDTSKVNLNASGTYYAIYTSKDLSNNTTTKKRKIVVRYDMSDLEGLARNYYDKYLAGKSVLEMTKYIKTRLGYAHTKGSDLDALYQILTTRSGSCRGHAFLLQKALDFAGYKNMVIKTTDGTHYWNLVYENGVWRHYDSTPGEHIVGPATDAQKAGSWAMGRRKWDSSLYPAAN